MDQNKAAAMSHNESTTETFEFTKRKIASERIALAKRFVVIVLAAFVAGAIGLAWSDSGSIFGMVRMAFLGVGGALAAYLLTAA